MSNFHTRGSLRPSGAAARGGVRGPSAKRGAGSKTWAKKRGAKVGRGGGRR